MTRILLWYWGRRGGGAQFSLSLARALAPGGLALSVSQQNSLISAFRDLPVPRQEVATYNGVAGFAAGFARLPALGAALRRFAAHQGTPIVISSMAHPWTPFLAPGLVRAGLTFVPVVHDAAPHPGDSSLLFGWRLDQELAAARAAVVLSDAVGAAVAARRPGLPLIRMEIGAHLPYGAAAASTRRSDFSFSAASGATRALTSCATRGPSCVLRILRPPFVFWARATSMRVLRASPLYPASASTYAGCPTLQSRPKSPPLARSCCPIAKRVSRVSYLLHSRLACL